MGQMQRLIQTLITLPQRLEYRLLSQQASTAGLKVKAWKVDATTSIFAPLERR